MKKTKKYSIRVGKYKKTFDVPDAPVLDYWYGYYPFARDSQIQGNSFEDYDIYLSGGMTGFEHFNYPKFNYVAKQLRFQRFRVFNPAENFGGEDSRPRTEYMKKDVRAVTRSSNILVLPESQTSEGVATELNVALGLGLGVYFMAESDETMLPLIVKIG